MWFSILGLNGLWSVAAHPASCAITYEFEFGLERVEIEPWKRQRQGAEWFYFVTLDGEPRMVSVADKRASAGIGTLGRIGSRSLFASISRLTSDHVVQHTGPQRICGP